MVVEMFHVEPDRWQAQTLRAFVEHQRLALKACKGPGKSTVLSWLGWNFLLTRPFPKVVATSITEANLRDGLWTEMAKWRHKAPLLQEMFEWRVERIVSVEHPETWWMAARSWSRGADPGAQADTLAGLHADYILFLIDEAGGVPDSVAAAAEAALATGVETKLVIAGNPTLLEGPLYRACTRERKLWWVKEITGDPDDPDRSPRISVQWAREQIDKYGRESPYVMVNVFGQFPPTSSTALLGVGDVERAQRRMVVEGAWLEEAKVLGVDVARFGDDRTVLTARQGPMCFDQKVFRNLNTMEVADQVAASAAKWRPDLVVVDQGGVGAGVLDRLQQMGVEAIGIDSNWKAIEARFVNRRAEMWWKMADWVKAQGCLPETPELVSELTGPQYSFSPTGKIVLESKDELKEKGLPSPDLADSLALTFAIPAARMSPQERLTGRKRGVLSEYDPLSDERLEA